MFGCTDRRCDDGRVGAGEPGQCRRLVLLLRLRSLPAGSNRVRVGEVAWEHNPQLGTPEQGPYYVYLAREGDLLVDGQFVPPGGQRRGVADLAGLLRAGRASLRAASRDDRVHGARPTPRALLDRPLQRGLHHDARRHHRRQHHNRSRSDPTTAAHDSSSRDNDHIASHHDNNHHRR